MNASALWQIQGEGRGARDSRPLLGPIPFIYMQFSAKILSNNRFTPSPQGLAPPPGLGNPGSATAELN